MDVELFGLKFSILKIINPIFYIVFITILYLLVRRILKTIFVKAQRKGMTEQQRHRVQTVHEMLKSILKYIALILIFLAILADFGVNITSLIAGLGVLTAILGLALQDMIKDMIAGIAIITEGQFSVGDMITVDGFKGTVLSVGLKTTQVENYLGEVKVISNRNIDGIINYSKMSCMTEVIIRAPYDEDPDKMIAILEQVKERLVQNAELVTGEIALSPVSGLEEAAVDYTIDCPCAPEQASNVQNLIRKIVLEEFKKAKVKIPYPKVVIKERE